MLVAPRVSTRASVLFTPCICTRNSVLMRLAASDSESPLVLQRASICRGALISVGSDAPFSGRCDSHSQNCNRAGDFRATTSGFSPH